eukprot:m.301263 g.301263  ORF g.301263 m.301263 type:complete len:302 (+) comp55220_c0_seq4:1413-2318(+)
MIGGVAKQSSECVLWLSRRLMARQTGKPAQRYPITIPTIHLALTMTTGLSIAPSYCSFPFLPFFISFLSFGCFLSSCFLAVFFVSFGCFLSFFPPFFFLPSSFHPFLVPFCLPAQARDNESDEEEAEREEEKLAEIEAVLDKYDPDVVQSKSVTQEERLHRLRTHHQINVAVELNRAPEVIFQPAMCGVDQAGLTEAIAFVINRYSPHVKQQIVKNVFLTGGVCSIRGFKERVEIGLRESLPVDWAFDVCVSEHGSLDAWMAASKWALSKDYGKAVITKQMYEEHGANYVRQHWCSNRVTP